MIKVNLTKEQAKGLEKERKRVMKLGVKQFHREYKDRINEGAEDGEAVKFLSTFFSEAFWSGYLYVTVEDAKARMKEEANNVG